MCSRVTAPLPYTPQPFHAGPVAGVGHPCLVAFFQALPHLDHLPRPADIRVYRERPHLVREVTVPADLRVPWACLVVKRFGWRGVQHYLASPFKRSKAMKAYATACHLWAHGLGTPLPLGVWEERRWGFLQYNVYATAAVANSLPLGQYYRTLPDGPAGLQEVIRLTATYIRRMHDSGLWHRDMVLGNFLLVGKPANGQLYLVDLNRAYRLPYMPLVVRALDLARMEWHEWWPQLCAAYSTERFPAARLLWLMHGYRRWRHWRHRVLRVLRPWRAWQRPPK